MKIAVVGGTGPIGSKVVNLLQQNGLQAIAVALDTGVDSTSGKGLPEALEGAEVTVDVENSPFGTDAAIAFFKTAGENISSAEAKAAAKHLRCRRDRCARCPWRSVNDTLEVACPEILRLGEAVAKVPDADGNPRNVVAEPEAP